ncbi:MAG: DUF6350 family protein, partial [Propionibacteriaceae bacterium]|nr:DUF6350 family protein [Propionibacteriaceae bacterium]
MPRDDSPRTRLKVETYEARADQPQPATMPWWLAAVGGAVVCAAVGWVVVTACVLVARLAGAGTVTGRAMELATRMWLLIHGGVLQWDGLRVSLVPLTLTAVVAVALHGVAGYAAKQAVLAAGSQLRPIRTTVRVTLTMAATYTAIVLAVTVSLDATASSLRAGLWAFALCLVTGFFGARRAVGWRVSAAWPQWLRVMAPAMGAGLLIALVGGVVALVTSLLVHRELFVTLTDQLNPGWAGGIVLVLVQLFFALNVIVWCVAWCFGPGFTLGDGSVVSLAGSQVGLLPALPITGALPTGVGSMANLVWLAVPVLAGAGAAAMVLRSRPRARFDQTAIEGGLAGVASGLLVVGLAALTGGGLGSARLSYLGPSLLPLLVLAPCLMGLSG